MKNKRHTRRIKRLALICTLSTVILVVSTYAWFIGMKTVNVSSFDVEIAATDGLSLSLNGEYWSDSVTISKDNYQYSEDKDKATLKQNYIYNGSTNTWGGSGLIPISTVGQVDADASRLIMFEKGSLTTTPGGYRLMASRLKNETVTSNTEEGNGFVAFDLFVRNLSGSAYYKEYNQLNEEAIYLTQSSAVAVSSAGENQDKTGIENSVRVAFAQIGRVEAEKDDTDGKISTEKATSIQGINCKTPGTDVTAICDRYAQIWEPNDTKHVNNAIQWYTTACKARKNATEDSPDLGKDVTLSSNYDGTCTTLTDGTAVPTYAVGSVIDYTHNIDVYDGAKLNKYESSVSATKINGNTKKSVTDIVSKTDGRLYEYDYFTDTEKMYTGMERPTFITLAPNSITKIRVYVYIEGQDVDNYDFASLGKQIKVNFGFTKERFFGSDIENYDGPTGVPTTPEAVS